MDPFSLDEADTPERQAALAAALRKQQTLGLIGQLSGDRVLSGVGQSLLSSADRGEQRLDTAKQRRLQLNLEAKKDAETNAYREQGLDLERKRLTLAQNAAAREQHQPVPTAQGYLDYDKRTGRFVDPATGRPIQGTVMPANSGMGGVGGDLAPEALDAMAKQYTTTGQFPQLGMGKAAAGLRVKIANRALELAPETDLAAARAGYGADTKSLAKQQVSSDAMNAFEGTALANLDTFLDQAKKVVDVGSPLFNAPAREFASRVRGDPSMAAFNTARQTAVQEVGKVLSGSLGGQAISDSARKEVEGLLGPDASLAQIQAAAGILKRDMANRRKAVEGQMEQTRRRIGGHAAPAEVMPDVGAADVRTQKVARMKQLLSEGKDDAAIKATIAKEFPGG